MRGKIVIAIMIAVALAMSGYAWWHRFQGGRRSAQWWGREAIVRIRYARRVDFVPLQPLAAESPRNDDDSQTAVAPLTVAGVEYLPGTPVEITRARGMVHVQHALVDDLSYEWSNPPPSGGEWDFLLRFADEQGQTDIAVDADNGFAYFIDKQQAARFVPKIADAFRQKHTDWQQIAENE